MCSNLELRHMSTNRDGIAKQNDGMYVRIAETSQENPARATQSVRDVNDDSEQQARRWKGNWPTWNKPTFPVKRRPAEQGGWKPVTLGGPVLLSLPALSVIGITLLEILARRSSLPSNGGGVVFAKDVNSFTMVASFT